MTASDVPGFDSWSLIRVPGCGVGLLILTIPVVTADDQVKAVPATSGTRVMPAFVAEQMALDVTGFVR